MFNEVHIAKFKGNSVGYSFYNQGLLLLEADDLSEVLKKSKDNLLSSLSNDSKFLPLSEVLKCVTDGVEMSILNCILADCFQAFKEHFG